MADQGTFDYWISDRITFRLALPKADSTGEFDQWISDRIGYGEYAEAPTGVTAVSVNISPGANYIQVV